MEQHFMLDHGDVQINVLAQGLGPVIVILPSLSGWHSETEKAENAASRATPVDEWFEQY